MQWLHYLREAYTIEEWFGFIYTIAAMICLIAGTVDWYRTTRKTHEKKAAYKKLIIQSILVIFMFLMLQYLFVTTGIFLV